MDNYVGTKHIKAREMTVAEYDVFRKKHKSDNMAETPKNHTPDTAGYLVGYPGKDGKTFDGPLIEGCRYISWAPKDVFEGVYKRIVRAPASINEPNCQD